MSRRATAALLLVSQLAAPAGAFLEQEIVQAEIASTEQERERLAQREAEIAKLLDASHRAEAQEAFAHGAFRLSAAVAAARREALTRRAADARAALTPLRGRLAETLEALAARVAGPDPDSVALRALAEGCSREVARLSRELAETEAALRRLDLHRREASAAAAETERGLVQRAALRAAGQEALDALALERAETQARLDALVAELQSLRPSLLLTGAEPTSELAATLPPPDPPPTERSSRRAPSDGRLNLPDTFARLAARATWVDGGLEVETAPGAEIRALEGGEVLAAGPLEGFGDVVILEHPGGVLSITASAASPSVVVGQQVAPGEVIARAGALRGSGAPGYRLEVRRGEESLDPAAWDR